MIDTLLIATALVIATAVLIVVPGPAGVLPMVPTVARRDAETE